MRFKLRLAFLLAFVLSIIGFSTGAHALNVAVVVTPGDAIHAQFSNALAASMADSSHRLVTIEFSAGQFGAVPAEQIDLVIAAGFAASEAAIARFRLPVLATLVNTRQIGILQTRHPDAKVSAIVLDQPIERHIRLVRAILGERIKLACMLGPETLMFGDELAEVTSRLNLQLVSNRILNSTELLPALDRSLESSHALLALPDPVTSGPTTARAILLSSYRLRRPVFAYSKAFVDAGALAAVFSSPADIGHDTAAWLSSLAADARIDDLPPPRNPRTFGIAINRQVARALRLEVADDASLLELVGAGDAP